MALHELELDRVAERSGGCVIYILSEYCNSPNFSEVLIYALDYQFAKVSYVLCILSKNCIGPNLAMH